MSDSDTDIFDEDHCHEEIHSDSNDEISEKVECDEDLNAAGSNSDDVNKVCATEVDSKGPNHTVSAIEPTAVIFNELKITVGEPEKKTKTTGLKMLETFVSYLIEATPKDPDAALFEEVTSIWRRYSEFESLRNYLCATYPSVIVAPLPEKRANFVWKKMTTNQSDEAEFLERRRTGLESFLHRVSSHPKLGLDKIVHYFVTKEEGWKEAVLATGFQKQTDSWLKRANASMRVKEPDSRFEQQKLYAIQIQSHITAVLKTRAACAEKLFAIYKIHGNFSRVYKEWALVEDASLREALQKAAVEVDVFSKSIDTLIDEEELIAEQLKEYYYFADSIKSVCQKHEAHQYDVEWFENQLAICVNEKRQIEAGESTSFSFSGMKARLLGIDKQNQIESRLEQLTRDIDNYELELEKHREILSKFNDNALTEIEYFKQQKRTDLREVFISYSILQIKLNREGLAIWSKIKSFFDKVKTTRKAASVPNT